MWIEELDALAVHEEVLAAHGGAEGVRDHRLLRSILARPREQYASGENPDIVGLAALYTAGIVRDRPFIDANQPTGFLLGALFLELNDIWLMADEADAGQAVLDLAAGKLDEQGFTAWMRANVKVARRTRGR